MKWSDISKAAGMAVFLALMLAVVLGLCYLVYGVWRESLKVRADMLTANTNLTANTEHLRQLNNQLALENQDNRNKITALEQNLSALQDRQKLIVDLAVQLRQEQLALIQQANTSGVQAPVQNITVIVQGNKRATASGFVSIKDGDKEIQNLSTADDTWQENCFFAKAGNLVCFRSVNETSPVNNTAAVNESCQIVADGRLMCWRFEEV